MKGIYILILKIRKDIAVRVGALGIIHFKKGLYAYIGSAQNNIEKRIKRHYLRDKKKWWHIDYLTTNNGVTILDVLYKEAGKDEECRTARILAQKNEIIEGFGSSDSSCKSHLIKIINEQTIKGLGMRRLE